MSRYWNSAPRICRGSGAVNEVFSVAFEDAPTYSARPPSDEYLTRVLGREEVIVLAALADDSVVGGLVAYELLKLEQERSEIYIYDLAVSEEYRRRGVATALIEGVKAVASAAGRLGGVRPS